MKKRVFFCLVLSILMLVLCFGPVFSLDTTHADTNDTAIEDVANDKFTIKIETTGKKTQSVNYTKYTTTEDVEYYVYNWRDLQYLTFKSSAHITDSAKDYRQFKILVSSKQTEDIETSTMSFGNPTELLSSPVNNIPNFTYYIDRAAQISDTTTNRAKGNDFGLYKFNFVYVFAEDEQSVDENEMSIGTLFIAVIPDNIDTLSTDEIKIKYNVTSSNELMNVYNLYIVAKDDYTYVNPARIKWEVVGKDKNNVNYVLTKEMRDSNPLYANYRVIYESQIPTNPIGPTFSFDSLGIEGTWKAYCTIHSTTGDERAKIESAELSTFRTPHKSYVWLVLGASLGAILLGGGIFLIIYKKKKN